MLRNLQHATIHGQVVVAGGDDEIGPGDKPVLIHLVMMNQRSARRFRNANALQVIGPGKGANVPGENLRLLQQLLHSLDPVKNFNQARIVVVKRAQDGPALEFAELSPLLVRARRAAAVGDIQPRQRPYAVDAFRITSRLVIRRLKIAPGLHGLTDEVLVLENVDPIGNNVAPRVHHAQHTVIMFKFAVLTYQPKEETWEIRKGSNLRAELIDDALEPVERPLRNLASLRQHGQDSVPAFWCQGLAHATRNHPGRMNALSGHPLNNLLTDLAQADAIPRHGWVFLKNAENIALRRVPVHSQQEVGRREVEEAQGV